MFFSSPVPLPQLPPGHTLAGLALALGSMGREGQRLPDSRKGKNWETKASQPSQPAPLRRPARVGAPFSPLPSAPSVGAPSAGNGGAAPTARQPCARGPAPAGGAAPTWARTGALPALLRSAAGRWESWPGAGGRREAPLYGAAAGRKEALVSQAGRIPAPGAHLSGQERGAAGTPPEKARARSPTDGGGAGRSQPLPIPSCPGRASPPLRAPHLVAALP